MIQRDVYTEKIIRAMWNGDVKVITGIRRCGKSVLLFDLWQGVAEEQIIRIALDQRRYYKYRNPITLCKYVEKLVQTDKEKQFYLFVDEVQMTQTVTDTENGNIDVTIYDMLNELKAYKNLDVYVTGSNSKGLSSDIATEFRGRATQIHMYPLSFKEYYAFVGGDERKALDNFMLYGGMPRLLSMQDDNDKKAYLSILYKELYMKDIVERNKVEREDILNDILDFLASQVGSLTNPTNIANALTSMKKEKVNPATVASYVRYMMDSYLIGMAKRYDVKGKTYFKYPNKYYYADTGLRNVDVGVVTDRSKGQNVQKEIDFVVNAADKKIYIQSAFQMETEQKITSEISSLLLAKDFFKKIVIRMDIPHNYYDENGIYHCNLTDFLLERVDIL